MLWCAIAAFACAAPARAAHVVISCGAVGAELELCRTGAEAWAHRTGNSVEVLAAPSSSGERLAQDQLLLAAHSSDIDVFAIDTTWPGILGDLFVDLRAHAKPKEVAKFFPAFVANNTLHGRLVALPWFIDAGVLYYRKDLLAKYGARAPETWEELTATARKIQDGERRSGARDFWGYVFEARAYEGLTCNALEWVHSFGGGDLIGSNGHASVDRPQAVRALELAASWIGSISPPGVLNYMEEEARGAFQAGNAAFLRNWPYVWKLANAEGSPVRGKIGMAPLPRGDVPGGISSATLGGWSLAVSRFSKNPDAAASLVLALTSREEQKRRALAAGLNPTRTDLYSDPVLRRANPMLPTLRKIFEHAVPRPSRVTGAKYNRASVEIWESVHKTLSHEGTAAENMKRLQSALERIGRNGRW